MLKPAKIQRILQLHGQDHVPKKQISRLLRIDLKTVRKYIRLADEGAFAPGASCRIGRPRVLCSVDQKELRAFFLECGRTCTEVHRRFAERFGIEPPSLRTLQSHCRRWRRKAPRATPPAEAPAAPNKDGKQAGK